MDKNEILKRAQQERKDEREEHIKVKAFHISWFSVSVVILFLIIFRFANNEYASDILMILMAHTAVNAFYQYYSLRSKEIYLYTGIISTVAFFLSLAALLSQYGVY